MAPLSPKPTFSAEVMDYLLRGINTFPGVECVDYTTFETKLDKSLAKASIVSQSYSVIYDDALSDLKSDYAEDIMTWLREYEGIRASMAVEDAYLEMTGSGFLYGWIQSVTNVFGFGRVNTATPTWGTVHGRS